MTFSNPLFDELVVGDPAGTHIIIQMVGGSPVIEFYTGDPAETAPGVIQSDGADLRITPPTAFGQRRLELDATQIIPGDPILGPDLLDPPGGLWSSTTAQSIPNNLVTTLTNYLTPLRDGGDCSPSAAGIWTPTRAGTWEFELSGRFGANATGLRMAYAQDLSGVDQEVGHEFAPGVTQPATFTLYWSDKFDGVFQNFRWRVLQNSGAALNFRMTRATSRFVSA